MDQGKERNNYGWIRGKKAIIINGSGERKEEFWMDQGKESNNYGWTRGKKAINMDGSGERKQ